MSCRVFALEESAHLQSARWPSTGPDAGLAEHTSAADNGTASGQVAVLHTRIVDLERSLQNEVRAAREAGFREGEKAGRESALAELAPVLERLTHGIVSLAGMRARLRREAERDLVSLAIAIARRVLRREISVDPEAIQGVVKAALEKVQSRDACRVRIYPGHGNSLRSLMERSGSKVEVADDASLGPGDFIVETKRGDLDASIDTQLQEIERGFADRIRP